MQYRLIHLKQMLELDNEGVIRHWLSSRPDIAAGVFFDDSDQLVVLTRDGTVEPLMSSPYSQRMGECIVYLDDAHTRGTDLKLPANFHAAATVGLKMTKDRFVQGQSLSFSTATMGVYKTTPRMHANAQVGTWPDHHVLCTTGGR